MGSPKHPYVHPPGEWLRTKYETEGLDCVQIARLFGCDPKTAWEWVKAAGIQTRKRGHGHPANHFQLGHRNSVGRIPSAETRAKIGRATVARGQMPYLKNGVHWLKTPGAVNGRWKGGITPERQTFYRSPEWKAAVKTVWERDNAICQRCGLDFRTVTRTRLSKFHIHHVDSFQIVERRTDPANLLLVCRPCHLWIHSKANIAREFLGSGHDVDPAPFWKAEKVS